MEEREDAEYGVGGADVNHFEDAFGFGFEIAMREHDALGVARSPRAVEDHGNVVGGNGNRLEGAGTGGDEVRQSLNVA